jgi:hypothetical protein
MYMDDISDEDLAAITNPDTESLPMEVESSEEPDSQALATAELAAATGGRTDSVRIYGVGCATGATASFRIPLQAFYWHARLGYFTQAGQRIGLSPIIEFPRSYYPPSTPAARWNGKLPTGTKDLRAFWWYGAPGDPPSGVWWNRVALNC